MAHQVRGTSSVMDKLIQILQLAKMLKCHLNQKITQTRTWRICLTGCRDNYSLVHLYFC